jgi:hypothetical protein
MSGDLAGSYIPLNCGRGSVLPLLTNRHKRVYRVGDRPVGKSGRRETYLSSLV